MEGDIETKTLPFLYESRKRQVYLFQICLTLPDYLNCQMLLFSII